LLRPIQLFVAYHLHCPYCISAFSNNKNVKHAVCTRRTQALSERFLPLEICSLYGCSSHICGPLSSSLVRTYLEDVAETHVVLSTICHRWILYVFAPQPLAPLVTC
jgi:hypothetical protein